MPSQLEEIGVDANTLQSQYFGPNSRHLLFCGRSGSYESCFPLKRSAVWRGECATVHFPIWSQRQSPQQYKSRGYHVLRQMLLEVAPQFSNRGRLLLVGDNVGHQPLVAGDILPGHDHDLAHRWMLA